jgi:hypothetical protein
MLTMAVFHWDYGITVVIDIDTADLRSTVYRLGLNADTKAFRQPTNRHKTVKNPCDDAVQVNL